MTSDVRGYVVRVNFEGHEDWICRISGNLCPCVKEERTLFTLGDAIEASKMPKAPAVATIFRVRADGREERLSSLGEALDHLAAVHEALAITPGETATGAARRVAAEIERLRAVETVVINACETFERFEAGGERPSRGELGDMVLAMRASLRGQGTPTDPLAALEAAEQRLLASEGWVRIHGDPNVWTWPPTDVSMTQDQAMIIARSRALLTAKKGGAQ